MTTCKPLSPDLPPETGSATEWISQGIETLLYDLEHCGKREDCDFDVVIVGSGYGGSVAAAKLAGLTQGGKPVSVCVLERGREHLPGMFPSRMSELAGHVRFSNTQSSAPRGVREGVFDFRLGPDVNALVANGLGGGSLINAGVMERPVAGVFKQSWPHAIGAGALDSYYEEALKLLKVERIEGGDRKPKKFEALRALGGGDHFKPASVTVALHPRQSAKSADEAEPSPAGVKMSVCKRCGDCATGCNHGSKGSLDLGMLVSARLAGAHLYTGATVLDVRPVEQGWTVSVTYTDDKLRKRHGAPFQVRARRVILAAGTFGSTEILLRSREDRPGVAKLPLSPTLGTRFSTNGDFIASGYRQKLPVNAIASENDDPGSRHVGPTITGLIDLRDQAGASGYVVEELAVPGPMRRLFTEIVTTFNALHELAEADSSHHGNGVPDPDPFAVNDKAMRHSSVLAVMGHDGSGGVLKLVKPSSGVDDGDGAVTVVWPQLANSPLYDGEAQVLDALHENCLQPGGRVIPNPLWKPVPDALDALFALKRGPGATVHPLGGCPMADAIDEGVVDDLGRVFRPDPGDPRATHDGLVVLDGSIVPTSLGINPSLTITALALRAVEGLSKAWGFEVAKPDLSREKPPVERARPTFRTPEVKPAVPTTVQIVERLQGHASLRYPDGKTKDCVVELAFAFKATAIEELTNGAARTLEIESGTARVFDPKSTRFEALEATSLDPVRDAAAEEVAPIKGSLRVFARQASSSSERRCRGLRAWWDNRGARDTWQAFVAWLRHPSFSFHGAGPIDRACLAFALATRAGEVRTLEYRLTVQSVSKGALLEKGDRILGLKTLSYLPKSNPWKQLSRVALEEFPGLVPPECTLELDLPYLAFLGIPLLKVVRQQDAPTAMAELGSLGLYMLRALMHIHVWSLRKPDDAPPWKMPPLPGINEGCKPLPIPIEVGTAGEPVQAMLTRYPRPDSAYPPVILIHGYSASGTTFAHPSVSPNLAGALHAKGHDVWILDLRTSCAMPTCGEPWSFEQVARADIPIAIRRVLADTKRDKVDIVAHCMGAAMLTIAVLEKAQPGDVNFKERDKLHEAIRRIVFSQVGPAVAMSTTNVLRAYVMQYLRFFFPLKPYEMHPKDPGLLDQFMDRALSTLPYPDREWFIENPPRFWQTAPFTQTRHRMDALFGRVMNAERMSRETLVQIDELFGRINMDTMAQPMQFARMRLVTDRSGNADWYTSPEFGKRLGMPILSLHAKDNGLADFATYGQMHNLFAGLCPGTSTLRQEPVEGGHQDQLIGKGRHTYIPKIVEFLEKEIPVTSPSPATPPAEIVQEAFVRPADIAVSSVAEKQLDAGSLHPQMPESVSKMTPDGGRAPSLVMTPYTAAGNTHGVFFVPATLKDASSLDVPGNGATLEQRIEAAAILVAASGLPGDLVTVALPGAALEPGQAWITLLYQDGANVDPVFPERVPGKSLAPVTIARFRKVMGMVQLNRSGIDPGIAQQIAGVLEDKGLSRSAFEKCLIYP